MSFAVDKNCDENDDDENAVEKNRDQQQGQAGADHPGMHVAMKMTTKKMIIIKMVRMKQGQEEVDHR